jgi:hypothetical protein
MVEIVAGDEPTAVLRKLIYAWCDRRCLEALKYVLPAYQSFNGLHEAWSSLYNALCDVRVFARYELTEAELEEIRSLIGVATQIIFREPRVC